MVGQPGRSLLVGVEEPNSSRARSPPPAGCDWRLGCAAQLKCCEGHECAVQDVPRPACWWKELLREGTNGLICAPPCRFRWAGTTAVRRLPRELSHRGVPLSACCITGDAC